MTKSIHSPIPPLSTIIVWAIAIFVTSIFLWILSDIIWYGSGKISWEFLTSQPEKSGRAGGIGSIIVSTLLILGVCLVVAVPIGIGTALFLAEFTDNQSTLGRIIRRSLDVLAAVPSIVFGLFGNVFFCQTLGLGFSILSGGLTIACMVLPILIRETESGFSAIPREYKLAAAALAYSRTTTIFQILLPAAIPGILVGLILGIGRGIAETAALIFTSGYVDRMPESLLDSGRSLAVHIFDLSMNVSGGDTNAYASALVLIVLLLIINTTTALIGSRE
ncbi:MAG TPA: phosphate ABC transporter permease PtsA [Cyanobacteria bacterium UBA11149]|nr:phosphate ABC transporter permease PtsA [Cyanobacteria bacterium UBA11367]HBE60687.1 phosphate ABC transporter permease PtsA [Cyanobacteria bacterium UBA11366]HBK63897.1 phosphate ABC transporter permease PtsA [Cyanobacteria bacterium UBA11166]HBR72990.1 phosphate ABC transporter permease PtsA [Cyanobacteria bacterium UBA11159]HBS69437.1 phosphate ABC transporter permease PtsA [Cyanobacteria bacterium UBA11153]HBW91954.1 phosphate ABC transporter permease PtsA [Cyanobacteria bacterium UBA11